MNKINTIQSDIAESFFDLEHSGLDFARHDFIRLYHDAPSYQTCELLNVFKQKLSYSAMRGSIVNRLADLADIYNVNLLNVAQN